MFFSKTICTILTESQQNQLNKYKNDIRIKNELYMRSHPEIKDILSYFVSQVLIEKPNDIREFAAGSMAVDDLRERIKQFREKNETYNQMYGDE